MTHQEQQRTIQDRETVLRAQRTELEADLTQLTSLIESESAKWAERRGAVHALQQQIPPEAGDDADEARMAWYVAAYQDAQQEAVMTHSLIERYGEIARALTSCQQE